MNKYFLKDLFEKPISGEWGKELEDGIIGFPVIRTTNFTNIGEINYDDLAYRDIDPIKKENKFLKLGDIIIEKSGGTPDNPVGRVVYFNKKGKKFFTNNFTAALRTINNADSKYLFYLLYYLHKRKVVLKYQNKTTGIINLQLNDYLKKTEVEIPTLSMQKETVDLLDGLRNLIKIRKEQIQDYDDLIESLFFEILNKSFIKEISFDDMFEIIDGDRGKNYPKKNDLLEEGYCLFLNTKNVTKTGFKFEQLEFITEEKDNKLRKGRTKIGDFILTTRGTVGNIAYIDKDIDFKNIRINSGMVILRRKLEINPKFFEVLIRKTDILVKAKSGSAQPQLPIKSLKKVLIPTIDVELQNKFADYVLKIEEEKKKLNESLLELESLFDALMEDAFSGNLFKE
ncbi:MAG: restriction endonuclease subunit S [Peptoniphilus harei]|nr:restriction endonuclease subunit S [Peptoniphilus harei]